MESSVEPEGGEKEAKNTDEMPVAQLKVTNSQPVPEVSPVIP
jgi:hypothetical protein